MTVNGNPVKLMDMMPKINCPTPVLGQDNRDVFVGKLGYSEEEYKQMKEEEVF